MCSRSRRARSIDVTTLTNCTAAVLIQPISPVAPGSGTLMTVRYTPTAGGAFRCVALATLLIIFGVGGHDCQLIKQSNFSILVRCTRPGATYDEPMSKL